MIARQGATRLWMRRLHLALGLTVGLLFVVLGLSGSLLVFYREIDAALNPEVQVAEGVRPPSWEAVDAALRRAHPDRAGSWRIEVPEDGGVITARYMNPVETAGQGFGPLLSWVDPRGPTVVRSELWGRFAMTWLYDLHFRLLAGDAGMRLLGAFGILILLLIGGGVWIWWPRPGHARAALTLKRHASPQRRVFDLHNLSGVYGLVPLLLLAATGTLLCLPEQVKPALSAVSPLFKAPVLRSTPDGRPRLTPDRAAAIARARFHHAALKWIETPDGPSGVYRLTLRQPGEPGVRFPRTSVWVDQYDGRVLAVRDGLRDSGGDRLLNWLHPLHSGEAGGMLGRCLACLAGLLPLGLAATGVLRWWHRARARRACDARRRAAGWAQCAGSLERPVLQK